MKKEIIALQGKGESGKTTSIGLFHEMLIAHPDFLLIETNFKIAGANKDFNAVFKVNGILVGVTSKGDTYDYVKWDLELLIKHGCNILFCACRTSDRSHKGNPPRGSNLAIDEYTENSEYRVHRIHKSVSGMESTRNTNNEKDAQRLLEKCLEFTIK